MTFLRGYERLWRMIQIYKSIFELLYASICLYVSREWRVLHFWFVWNKEMKNLLAWASQPSWLNKEKSSTHRNSNFNNKTNLRIKRPQYRPQFDWQVKCCAEILQWRTTGTGDTYKKADVTTAFQLQNLKKKKKNWFLQSWFYFLSYSRHHISHKGQGIKRDRENGREIHVMSLLCKSLTGYDDELMKSLTNRCMMSQQQTERCRDRPRQKRES